MCPILFYVVAVANHLLDLDQMSDVSRVHTGIVVYDDSSSESKIPAAVLDLDELRVSKTVCLFLPASGNWTT